MKTMIEALSAVAANSDPTRPIGAFGNTDQQVRYMASAIEKHDPFQHEHVVEARFVADDIEYAEYVRETERYFDPKSKHNRRELRELKRRVA